MLSAIQIKWLYALSGLFVALNLAAFYFDMPFAWLIPPVVLVAWLAIYSFDTLFYVVAFAVPLSVNIRDVGFGLGIALPTEPIIAALMLGIIFKLLLGQSFDRRFLFHPLTLLILFNLSWLFITTLTSSMPVVSLKYFLSRCWFVLVFYFAAGLMFRSARAIIAFNWCFIIATSIVVFYTLAKHSQHGFSRFTSYGIMYPFYPDHGIYAASIAFFLPMILVFVLAGNVMRLSPTSRIIALALGILVTVGVVFSYTRATWLSLAAAFGVYMIFRFRIKFITLISIAGTLVLLFFIYQDTIMYKLGRNKQTSDENLTDHLQSVYNIKTDPSNLERINRWNSALRMFDDKPIFGFGPGTYVFQYAPYQQAKDLTIISTNAGTLGNAHSEYLAPLSEQGLLGLISVLSIVIYIFYRSQKLFYESHYPHVRYLVLGILLGLITYFVHGVLNNYSDYDKIAVPMWSFMAMLTALDVYHSNYEKREEI